MIGDEKGRYPEESAWVCNAPTKEPKFGLERVKETFMEAKKSFMEASTSGSKDKTGLPMRSHVYFGSTFPSDPKSRIT